MKIRALIILLLSIGTSYASTGIDAAMMINKETVVFFKGEEVISFNMVTDSYIKTVSLQQAISGIPFTKVDAAINYGNGKAYLFSGNEYCRFDLATFLVDPGYPRKTSEYWNGINYDYLSAATNWGEKAFFVFRRLVY